MANKQKSVASDRATKASPNEAPQTPAGTGWKELYLKEDWWAIYLGIGIVVISLLAFLSGSTVIKSLSVNPGGLKWSSLDQLGKHFANNAGLYVLQLICWLIIFGIPAKIMGIKGSRFIPSFIGLYILSVIMFALGGWVNAPKYNMEPPLLALIVGLFIANFIPLPKWLDSGFRVEYYVKTGIVLLGATFPITLVVSAGPVALFQAGVISLATCITIYFAATKIFGLDKRLASVLGVGGAVCGVSASIAIASSVKAKKEDLYTTVTLVVVWALIMIFFIPFVAKLFNLDAGQGGAWVGTSEFADAAGFAAATAYGRMAGAENVAIQAFTLMKVIGRDIWIGIWSFIFALIACFKWEKDECGVRPSALEIWWRFPKFVIGFFVASLIMSAITAGYAAPVFDKLVKPGLLGPISALRGWTFIFCFLSIGLTTRFRELKGAGWSSVGAFSMGVVVNVVLGFLLSAYVFGSYWSNLGK